MHNADSLGDDVHAIALQQKRGRARYLYVDSIEGVIDLVQMNTLEFHPWGARIDDPERPDRIVFDLDPGEGVRWTDMVAAASETRDSLPRGGLRRFVRRSGGQGLDVAGPNDRGRDWHQLLTRSVRYVRCIDLEYGC